MSRASTTTSSVASTSTMATSRAARQYLEEGWQSTQFVEMPAMPPGDPRPSIETVVRAEAAIREGRRLTIRCKALPPYWRDIVRLLEIFGHSKRGERRDPENPAGDGPPRLQGIHHQAGKAGAYRARGRASPAFPFSKLRRKRVATRTGAASK